MPINKIKLKFFGHSGVGKSTLIESLKVFTNTNTNTNTKFYLDFYRLATSPAYFEGVANEARVVEQLQSKVGRALPFIS